MHAMPRTTQFPGSPHPHHEHAVPLGKLDRSSRRATDEALEARVEAELAAFVAREKQALGLAEAMPQFTDMPNAIFTKAQRPHTTVLVSGLTLNQDLFVTAALAGLGYRVQALECPDVESLRYGKEFGNRGQCNPTYFTVGNLVKVLSKMRDSGMSTADIIDKFVFLTAGACGPCRFGSYITEYRKALRDAGFDGFRVIVLQQTGGLDQVEHFEAGLELNVQATTRILFGLLVGDVLNALGYRIRPYEVITGETDRALDECREWIRAAFASGDFLPAALFAALLRTRLRLARVEVDRTRVKPKVSIIGEFWAMTTEGDGNYRMPSFLEQEGAEVEVQALVVWLLYMVWEHRFDTKARAGLGGVDGGPWGLQGVDVRKHLAMLWVGERGLRIVFHGIAKLMGLRAYALPDMDEVAAVAKDLYHNESRGGEGHMEIAKVILNTVNNKVNMTLSVKPFGCMPSSGVSDGVQTVVQTLHPKAIFLPIETTGDGAVNVYSRVQMMLFRARRAAEREVEEQLARAGLSLDEARDRATRSGKLRNALHRSPHVAACTAANVLAEAGRRRGLRERVEGLWGRVAQVAARS